MIRFGKKGQLSRRAFLRGAGGVAIGLPFLGAMACSSKKTGLGQSSRASITPEGFPRRFVVFFTANGTIPQNWRPTGGETDFQLSTILQPLERHRQKLVILEGVDMVSAYNGPGDGHQKGMGHMLTGTELEEGDLFTGGNGELAGWGGGISIDQHIANAIGRDTKFPSLELGVQVSGSTVWSRMSYKAPGEPLPPDDDPTAVFSRVFGDLDSDPNSVARLKAQRKIVLDTVAQDFEALNARLGAEDRAKLESHLEAVRDIERRLESGGIVGASCAVPELGPGFDHRLGENYPQVGTLQMDMLAMALACDLTRVVSLQWDRSVSNKSFPWLGISDRHHDLSHEGDSNADAVDKLTRINTWYAEQFAYLLDKLDAIPEGSGTLLDNTIVLWCNELGKGNSHTRRDVPFVLAGGGGGRLSTGRYLSYDGDVPHNNLFVSLMNAFDIEGTSFGNPAYCTGPLDRLT